MKASNFLFPLTRMAALLAITATLAIADPPRSAEDAITPSANVDAGRHQQFMARKAQGEIGLLFLGDSITDFWPANGSASWLKFAPYHPADFGISGERTEGVLAQITHEELDGIAPKVTVIMIGTNNIGHFQDEKPEWTAAGVKKIVEAVHAKLPQTSVILLGVFPRGAIADPLRAKVTEINKLIASLDDGNKTHFMDIGKVFLDEKGNIPADVMPDGLHPNSHGYDLWYESIHAQIEELMK